MSSKPRGRPRHYDPEHVLQQVLLTFWRQGYADTSVDELCEAAGLNKASLYAGFGDKAQLYRLALWAYIKQAGLSLQAALDEPGASLQGCLHKVVARTAVAYRAGRGCFMVSTAPMVAWQDDAVRASVHEALSAQVKLLAQRFKRARSEGDVCFAVSDEVLAGLVAAVLHSMSLRARAGESEQALVDWAQGQLDGLLTVAASRGNKPPR